MPIPHSSDSHNYQMLYFHDKGRNDYQTVTDDRAATITLLIFIRIANEGIIKMTI